MTPDSAVQLVRELGERGLGYCSCACLTHNAINKLRDEHFGLVLEALEKESEATKHFVGCDECALDHGLVSPCRIMGRLEVEAEQMRKAALAAVAAAAKEALG